MVTRPLRFFQLQTICQHVMNGVPSGIGFASLWDAVRGVSQTG